jgi:hypothetical protein
MKFVYPIEKKSPEELYKLNREGFGGYFPIGLNNCYHGGIHLDGKHPIVAIADGTVIAYRYRKKYIEQENSGKKFRYTNGFVLIRHEYTSPKGQKLVFFSLYNHLCPWEEFSEEQKKRRPALFTKPGFKVTASALNVRSSMDSSGDGNIIAVSKLSKGDEVIASAVDEQWAKKDGVDEYFVHKGYTEPVEITAEPSFDEIVATNISVKAGALVGYTGLLEFKSIPEGQTTCHIEVFAGDDAVPFFQNLKKDGEKKPTMFQVSAGAILRIREKKYPNPAALVKVTLKANTAVTVIEQDTGSDWIHVRERELTRSVKREWLEYHDDKAVEGDEHYTPKKEHLADVSKAFDSLELSVSSKFKYVGKDGEENRMVRYTVPKDDAEEFWVKKSSLGEIKDNTATAIKDIPDCFRQNPDALSFQKESGKAAEALLLKIDGVETAKDDEKKLWYNVKSQSVDGWICEDDKEHLKKLSAFDWPGFSIQKEEGDTAYDPIIDINNLSPFFKRIVDEINTDSDKSTISKDELKKAMKDEKISHRLSRLICFHQSEWWVDSEMKYWESVFKMIGSKQAELQKEVFRNTCWWDEVSQKSKDFLPTPNVYHWHPVAFVENMRGFEIPFIFPLKLKVDSYLKFPSRYNDGRDKDSDGKYQRRHAGCDLYAPVGSEIIAVKDGVIIQSPYEFYDGTYAIEIDHEDFVCRYGELQSNVPTYVKAGASIKQGQVIGYVGKLQTVAQSMLHFEMFSGEQTGALTKKKNLPFQRRSDLIDPTNFLNRGEVYE